MRNETESFPGGTPEKVDYFPYIYVIFACMLAIIALLCTKVAKILYKDWQERQKRAILSQIPHKSTKLAEIYEETRDFPVDTRTFYGGSAENGQKVTNISTFL